MQVILYFIHSYLNIQDICYLFHSFWTQDIHPRTIHSNELNWYNTHIVNKLLKDMPWNSQWHRPAIRGLLKRLHSSLKAKYQNLSTVTFETANAIGLRGKPRKTAKPLTRTVNLSGRVNCSETGPSYSGEIMYFLSKSWRVVMLSLATH